jgi:penicillin-binding protein 1C
VAVLLGTAALLLEPTLEAPPAAVASFEAVRAAYHPSDARLLDRYGEVLHEQRIDGTRRRLGWSPLADVSPALQAAVIASEDRRFYRHHGADWRALAAAALRRLTGGPPRGGSTITMQAASLLEADLRRAGGPRTLAQKWRQVRLALAMERRWAKAEVLEAYLNLVTFRGELEGVAAAAAVLFGKAPHGLTEAEAAVLAALLRSPNAGHAAVARRAWGLREAQGSAATRGDVEAAVVRALERPWRRTPPIGCSVAPGPPPRFTPRSTPGSSASPPRASGASSSSFGGGTSRTAPSSPWTMPRGTCWPTWGEAASCRAHATWTACRRGVRPARR